MKDNSLHIILPHRIGDCLLTLPAINCLKKLSKQTNLNITLICGENMFTFIKSLNIAKTSKLSIIYKLKSWLFPIKNMFCFLISSKLAGIRAKKTFGQNKNKWYLNFTVNIPYLLEVDNTLFPDKNFADYLRTQYNFSDVIINNFALCYSFGYTSEQIKYALKEIMNSKYVIMCLEAGYGKKKDKIRCYNNQDFFKLADYIYQKYNLSTVFVGINKSFEIPDREYFTDCRGNTSIQDLAVIISSSCAYIGNDTGPLHLANYLHKPTLGIYTKSKYYEYGPVFGKNNYPVQNPKSFNDVQSQLDKMLNEI